MPRVSLPYVLQRKAGKFPYDAGSLIVLVRSSPVWKESLRSEWMEGQDLRLLCLIQLLLEGANVLLILGAKMSGRQIAFTPSLHLSIRSCHCLCLHQCMVTTSQTGIQLPSQRCRHDAKFCFSKCLISRVLYIP